MTIYDDTLIMDIETLTFGKPDATKDRLRVFGCYSYKTGKTYMLKSKEDIKKIISQHKYLVGFNNQGTRREPGYDNPILIREGINLKYKIIIDLRNIIKERASVIKIDEGLLSDLLMKNSLKFITETLGIVNKEEGKMDIDYTVFQKETWTKEETKEILAYTRRDIDVTKKLYEWVEKYFEGFKAFLTDDNIKKKKYLTASTAGFSYRAICHAMKWEETYNTDAKESVNLKGGYMAYPAGEEFKGNIYYLDFASLYPHITIQCNLYGRKKEGVIDDRPIWTGGGKWKVQGTYYADELSGVCELFKVWYSDRLTYKIKGDKREYSIKIILNTGSYGILNHSYYDKVFDKIAGSDCPQLGRQFSIYGRKVFRKEGYILIYHATDGFFIQDPYNDKKRLLKVKDKIIKDIKATLPFPQDTFDMGIDDEIKYMFFFKGEVKVKEDEEMDEDDFINKPKGLLKQNYIYVAKIFKKNENGESVYTGKDKVVIKNLGIKKKSVTPLTKKIFWEHLVPKIKEGQIKFGKAFFKDLIYKLLEKDITLVAKRYDVGSYEQYKDTSPTSLPAQITQKYGQGIRFLIPNTVGIGVGKGKSYCKIEEFKENNLRLEHIDLKTVWKELHYFIKIVPIKNIFDF